MISSEQAGHDGASLLLRSRHLRTLAVQLHALLGWKPLSSLTSDPAEWIDQSEVSGVPMWQNKRDPAVFSTDGGKTWYSLDDCKP